MKYSEAEIEILAEGGSRLYTILRSLAAAVKPGGTGADLNLLAERLIAEEGGEPAFKGYGQPPYPAALCVSINDCVIHGIPSDRPFVNGDIVSLDLGIIYKGYYTDSAITVGVGTLAEADRKLISVTYKALQLFIKELLPGAHSGDGAAAVEKYIESQGFGVVRDYCGHGVGKHVHEDPPVPNYGRAGTGFVLQEGMVLAIEPMVTAGDWRTEVADNGWDVTTIDGSRSAHFEHTIAITKKGCRILTT